MKTKTYPIFHIDGRRARTLRKELGMPSDVKDLDEDTTTEITQIELALVADALNLPRLKYDHLADPSAFLCGGALTAWIGGYPPSDYDFFFPVLEMAERLHQRLLYQGAVLDGHQGTEAGQPIYEAIQKGELHLDELVIENEEIRALNYSMPTNERPDLIQIVLLIQGDDPLAIIDTFDFTISQLGTDGEYLYFGEHTWTDLFRRRLRVHNIHHGVSTMRRMVKYSRRGFYACVGTMRDVAQGVVDSPADQPISVD
jgi:hypothetical protein